MIADATSRVHTHWRFPSYRIDCVGILKLRNADIELRKGETDVGRKNTRVRLVFRVHVPQPGGQHVSLQVASHPIECCKHLLKHFHTRVDLILECTRERGSKDLYFLKDSLFEMSVESMEFLTYVLHK